MTRVFLFFTISLAFLQSLTFGESKNNLKEQLMAGDWHLIGTRSEGASLKFNEKDFLFRYSGEGIPYAEVSGTYFFRKNKAGLQIKKTETHGHQGRNLPDDLKYIKNLFNEKTCLIKPTPNDIEYSVLLQCDHTAFWDYNKKNPPGKEVTVNGVRVVTVKERKISVTDTVFFRTGPDVSAKTVQCGSGPGSGSVSLISPDQNFFYDLRVYARTKEKVKIKSWNNYWYYVMLQKIGLDECMRATGWIYGEFIRFDKSAP